MVTALLRILAYLTGAQALMALCIGIVWIVSTVLGQGLVGLGEMGLVLCVGLTMGAFSCALFRLSRRKPTAEIADT